MDLVNTVPRNRCLLTLLSAGCMLADLDANLTHCLGLPERRACISVIQPSRFVIIRLQLADTTIVA